LFAPRLGFAYRPMSNTVIRGGFALNHEQINMARDGLYNYPESIGYDANSTSPYEAVGSLSNGVPTLPKPEVTSGVIPLPVGATFETLPLNFKRGYVESFNFTVERGFGDWLAQVGYVGTHTVHQHTRENINYGQIGGGVSSEPLYILHGISIPEEEILPLEHMRYDSLQASLQRRFTKGLLVRASYTFSKWLGTCCETNGDGAPEIPIPQYFHLNYALEPGDRTHIFNLTAIYQLPFGRGKSFVQHGAGAAILGGWQLDTVLIADSGTPFSILADGTSLNAPGSQQRADQVKSRVAIHGGINEYFDPTAYAPVTQPRFGTASFDSLRGPGVVNADLGIFRSFNVREKVQTQFRLNVFNLTNTPHFSNPGNNIANVQYGGGGNITNLNGFSQITSTSGLSRLIDERYLQLGLKIVF
jgi:hypothetical protein